MPACSACHGEIAEGARFCSACGAAVDADVMATRTVPSTPPPPLRRPSSSHSTTRASTPRTSRDGRFSPGDVLAGRYRILAMLGKGGMGEVYRADDLSLEQPVALKSLPRIPRRTTNPPSSASATKSASPARWLTPTFCRVYDLGEIDGLYFLSMEYVDGEDLGCPIRRIARLSVDKALDIARKRFARGPRPPPTSAAFSIAISSPAM